DLEPANGLRPHSDCSSRSPRLSRRKRSSLQHRIEAVRTPEVRLEHVTQGPVVIRAGWEQDRRPLSLFLSRATDLVCPAHSSSPSSSSRSTLNTSARISCTQLENTPRGVHHRWKHSWPTWLALWFGLESRTRFVCYSNPVDREVRWFRSARRHR